MIISSEDKEKVLNAINLPNTKYSETLMSVAEKYQLFSADDIVLLTDQKKSKTEFQSDYAMLRLIVNPENIKKLVKDKSGYNRYYPKGYSFGSRTYAFTSQLYGYGGQGTHKDNRTPFFRWFIKKAKIENSLLCEQYPINNEDDPNKVVTEGPISFDLTDKEVIEFVENYIESKGFIYSEGLIENLYLSLKSKPFVILAGTSGTGKTKLVKLFAEAIDAHYKMVPVRPDWSDSSDLFGHVDLNGEYVVGEVLEFIAKAQEELNRPYILCLDEMNLARVEYYLSDFLSVIETREKRGSKIVSDPLVTLKKYGTDTAAMKEYGEIRFPQNLYLVGTVNMDETTFPFSKKVLDRANTIEFNYVELVPKFEGALSPVKPLEVPNRFLQTEYLVLERDCADEQDYVTQICDNLQRINEILRKANAHVGYRVRDEIVFYMLNNKKAGNLLTEEQAFDNEIMQKILPRIQGSAVSIKDMLIELFKFCMGDQAGVDQDNGNVSKQMENKADSATYKESAKKIGYMMKRYEEDGFTSYWL